MWNQSKPQISLLFYKLFLLKEIIAQTSEINPQIAEVQQIYNSLPLDTRNFIENNKEVIDLSKFLGDELQNKISNCV